MLLFVLACNLGDAQEDAEDIELGDHMARHGTHLTDTRDAIIDGNLERAAALGQALAASPRIGGLPENGAPFEVAFFAQATRIGEATDLVEAGRAVGRTAQACGDCHAALSGGPAREGGEAPADGGALSHEMARHSWAAERMWTGLLLDDAALLAEGMAALEAAPLVPTGLPSASNLPTELAALEVTVHDKAAAAVRAAESGGDAGGAFGEMLAACATCHLATGGGPTK